MCQPARKTIHLRTIVVCFAAASLFALVATAAPPPDKPNKAKKADKAKVEKPQSKASSGSGAVAAKPLPAPPNPMEFLSGFTPKLAHQHAVKIQLTGQQPLPPGVAKNLAKGKPLPPGIAKKSLPSKYVSLLPNHKDFEWLMAGPHLLLMSKTDKLVREIYRDVFK